MSSRTITLSLSKDKKQIRLIADALSSETRLKMVEEIKKGCDSHKKLADKVGVKSSSITFHLISLLNSGIIYEEDGKGLLGRKNKNPQLKIKKIVIEL